MALIPWKLDLSLNFTFPDSVIAQDSSSSAEELPRSGPNDPEGNPKHDGSDNAKPPNTCIRAKTRDRAHRRTHQRAACCLGSGILCLYGPSEEGHSPLRCARSCLLSHVNHHIPPSAKPNIWRPPCQQLEDQPHGDYILGMYFAIRIARDQC